MTKQQLDLTPATDKPVMAEALILSILPLQDYLLTESARNSVHELWKFNIGELRSHLSALTNEMNNLL
jgi:hypothetical protein